MESGLGSGPAQATEEESEVVSAPASEQESALEWKYVGTAHVVVVEGASMVKAVAVVLIMVVVVLVYWWRQWLPELWPLCCPEMDAGVSMLRSVMLVIIESPEPVVLHIVVLGVPVARTKLWV